MDGIRGNAGLLYGLAKEAYGRIDPSLGERDCDQRDALVAVILCAAALEAFVKDSLELAKFFNARPESPEQPPQIRKFILTLEEVDTERGSVNLKYIVARLALSGKQYEKGTPPYQDFALLIKLRNALVHVVPLEYGICDNGRIEAADPKKLLEGLRTKNILAEVN